MANKKKAGRVTSTNNKKGGNSKAKQQRKQQQSGVFDAAKAAHAAVVQGVLHPGDPTVEFCQYLATGKRLDAKALVKKLPATTQQMQANEIDPRVFSNCLNALVYDVQFAAQQNRMTRDNVSDHLRMVVLHVAKGLGKLALGGTNKIDAALPEAQDFLHDYAQRCYERSQLVASIGNAGGPWRHIQFYQLAMDEVCEQHAPQFDALLAARNHNSARMNSSHNKIKTTSSPFLQNCPMYQKPILVYSALAETLFDETTQGKMMDSQAALAEQKRHLALAAQGVTKGLHDVKRTCWECGVVHTKSIQCCTLCHVANYCVRLFHFLLY